MSLPVWTWQSIVQELGTQTCCGGGLQHSCIVRVRITTTTIMAVLPAVRRDASNFDCRCYDRPIRHYQYLAYRFYVGGMSTYTSVYLFRILLFFETEVIIRRECRLQQAALCGMLNPLLELCFSPKRSDDGEKRKLKGKEKLVRRNL